MMTDCTLHLQIEIKEESLDVGIPRLFLRLFSVT